ATLANNVLVGWAYYYDKSVQAADVYVSNGISVSESYTTKQALRNTNCSGTSVVCGAAGLTSTSLTAADVKLSSTSTARNTG
ncbi:hypothetical protein ACP3W1_27140, partial [Salmonella enterica]|uniref:hypothetical protein n=1 Tax=Salmonella enterica TaxID=28901 RepID=UPI003CF6451A